MRSFKVAMVLLTSFIMMVSSMSYAREQVYEAKKINLNPAATGFAFEASPDNIIGLAFHINECENGTRKHQIGWTPGGAWDAAAYGDLIFSEEAAAMNASDKLTTTWGGLKIHQSS